VRINAALVREQGVSFTVVQVKQTAMQPANREQTRRGLASFFPGVPIVLMSEDYSGRPIYSGRPDIVRWLSNIFAEQLPWKEYIFAAA